ncbi:HGGxSTG domain-containing protein [Streptomyces sp. NPDC018833]|uniref:HGGxSTG domain-containing protein n=1 Tax=Streptomyces sp. NPDC018833 TaxID=3365053 RepID=UPI0037B44ACC
MARTQSRCGALTQQGTRCRRLAMENASRCDLHRGDWSTYTIKKRTEAAKKAKTRKRRK